MSKKTLSELRITADEAKKELNLAILDDKFSAITAAKAKMTEAIKEYNTASIIADFINLRSKESPMLAAIEQLSIATIAAKENKNKDTGVITYDIEPAVTQISLLDFDEFCKREQMDIATNKIWHHMVDKLCLLVTYRVAKSLGKDTKKLEETYYISDIAKQVDMGATPTSNTQILKQIQAIIDAVIYEDNDGTNIYKASSHDVAYVVQTMTKRGKSGQIVTPRPTTMHTLIMDVLHRIVTNGDYKVEYVTKNQAKENQAANTDKTDNVK